MTHAFAPAALADEAALYPRRGTSRVLVLCLALSLALHLAMLFGLPGFAVNPEPPKAYMLDVVVRATAPQVSAEAGVTIPPAPATELPRDVLANVKVPKVVRHVVRHNRKPEPDLIKPVANSETAPDTFPVPTARAEQDGKAPSTSVATGTTVPARHVQAALPPSFKAGYLHNPPPPYPLVSRRNGEQGRVILKVRVTRDGLPASVDVEKTSRSSHLDDAARETVRTWRFVPARQNGQPVEAWVLVPIVFRLEPIS